jgi:hypothetical protein
VNYAITASGDYAQDDPKREVMDAPVLAYDLQSLGYELIGGEQEGGFSWRKCYLIPHIGDTRLTVNVIVFKNEHETVRVQITNTILPALFTSFFTRNYAAQLLSIDTVITRFCKSSKKRSLRHLKTRLLKFMSEPSLWKPVADDDGDMEEARAIDGDYGDMEDPL